MEKNDTQSGNPPKKRQIRISFRFDVDAHPELSYLADLTGHGDRPRELLRLAVRGALAEQQDKELLEKVRAAGIGLIPSSPTQEAPVRAAQEQAPEQSAATPEVKHDTESESENTQSQQAKPTPATPPAQSVEKKPVSGKASNIRGFLA